MKRATCAALLLAAQMLVGGALASPAPADDGPICRRPEILAFVADNLLNNVSHIELVADTATEFATSRANIVICAVTVQVKFYDPVAYRDRPAILSQSRYFEVKRLRDGFEVNFDGR